MEKFKARINTRRVFSKDKPGCIMNIKLPSPGTSVAAKFTTLCL